MIRASEGLIARFLDDKGEVYDFKVEAWDDDTVGDGRAVVIDMVGGRLVHISVLAEMTGLKFDRIYERTPATSYFVKGR